MRLTILGLLLALIAAPAIAYQNATYQWTPPTQNTDLSPLADADIQEYRLYCNGALFATIPNTGGTDTWTSADGSQPPGVYNCTMSTVNTAGIEGPESAPVNFTVPVSTPGAPGGLTVTFP